MNESTIYKKLNDFFKPDYLEVINDSDKHKGHAGSPNTGILISQLKLSL